MPLNDYTPPNSLPTFSTDQIVQALRTSFIKEDTSTTAANDFLTDQRTFSWGTGGAVIYRLDTATMSAFEQSRIQLAYAIWEDFIAVNIRNDQTAGPNVPGNNRFTEVRFVAIGPQAGEAANQITKVTKVGTNAYGTDDYRIDTTDLRLGRTFAGGEFDGTDDSGVDDGGVANLTFGRRGFETILHETGHGLGLSHSGFYNEGDVAIADGMRFDQDNRRNTIMSYVQDEASGADSNAHWGGLFVSTPMIYDILTVQRIYGVDTQTRLDNTVYGFANNSGRPVYSFSITTGSVFTIWDAGGADTLNASQYNSNSIISLLDGTYSSIGRRFGNSGDVLRENVGIAFGVLIENAIGGTGNDRITGNQTNNRLVGNGGSDRLDGGLGADWLQGGQGSDTYVVDNPGDIVDDSVAPGTIVTGFDTVRASIDYALGPQIENLVLLGSAHVGEGNSQGNVIFGNSQTNTLYGRAGNDYLDGSLGDDRLFGGPGTDTLIGGAANDTADYSDTATRVVAFLGAHLVNSQVVAPGATGSEIGSDNFTSIDHLTGGGGSDQLNGNDGGNILKGGGGADTLSGGLGADWLQGDSENDFLKGGGGADVLDGGAGTDTASYADSTAGITINLLTNFAGGGFAQGDTVTNLENINGSPFGDVLIGNTVANRLRGDNGKDSLKGGGGADLLEGEGDDDVLAGEAGSDTLDGGAGLDTADYTLTTAGVTVFTGPHTVGNTGFTTGTADGSEIAHDTLRNIENVFGGSGADTITGDSGVNRIRGGGGNDTIDGNLGVDTADYSDSTQGVTVFVGPHQIGPNQFVTTGTASGPGIGSDILRRIENIIGGSGNDVITGDGAANSIIGGLGNDELDGGAGVDTADYSNTTQGVTVFTGPHQVGQVFVLSGTANGAEIGSDTLRNIENVVGGSGADSITGDGANNVFAGGAGNDTMNGGAGFDFADYSSAAAGVVVDLGPTSQQNTVGAGSDTLSNFEGIIGSRFGDILLRGFASSVTLRGGAGDDLFHDHNAGNDTFDGGAGKNTVDYSTGGADMVTVDLTAGRATSVGGSINTLISIANATGSGGGDRLLGDGLANVFRGLGGNDILDGKGGADTMIGGLGDDTYVVDNGADQIIEAAGQGNDNVNVSVSYALGVGVSVETLRTVAPTATTTINLSGNEFVNILRGNAGINVLNGRGDGDTMQGLAGNDTYLVDNAGDKVLEVANGGTDTVFAYVNYTLQAGVAVEKLVASASAARSLTGNELGQTIEGNAENNLLFGKAGKDILTGGAGIDYFTFDTAPSVANVDTITDFSVPLDTIRLENAVFTALGTTTGIMAAAKFFKGAAAHDADDRVIYNAVTGALIYDTNGNAAGGAVQFAKLATGLALTNADLVVI